jgi:hypothetical protein
MSHASRNFRETEPSDDLFSRREVCPPNPERRGDFQGGGRLPFDPFNPPPLAAHPSESFFGGYWKWFLNVVSNAAPAFRSGKTSSGSGFREAGTTEDPVSGSAPLPSKFILAERFKCALCETSTRAWAVAQPDSNECVCRSCFPDWSRINGFRGKTRVISCPSGPDAEGVPCSRSPRRYFLRNDDWRMEPISNS